MNGSEMDHEERLPLVSCIVPVYNGERFLADAVRSILGQRDARVEVIVVDDGSVDQTPDVIASFGSSVRSFRQTNQGPAAARNVGIGEAGGQFIAFLDADDLWHEDKLVRQLARFRERPELQLCFAGMRNVAFQDVGDVSASFNPDRWPNIPFSPCTLLARRQIFDHVGLFDPALRRGEDTEWFVRMMTRGVVYEVMPEVLLERRIHGANLTAADPPTPLVVVDMLKRVLDRRRREGW